MRIAQIADIHIRLYSRHDEYREVFQRLYDDLREQKVERIVVVGDIFHSKSILSPEAVKLCSDFLYQLGMIAPTEILIGNHDVNLKDKEKLDSISPILSKMKMTPCPIRLHLNSGLVEDFDGPSLVYGVFSCMDEDDTSKWPIHIPDKRPDRTYVALFHGNLIGAKTESHYTFTERETPYEPDRLFAEYEYAMLGDIHGAQRIGSGQYWYCGSLIQQNFGEILPKGYLIWKVSSGNVIPEFRPIANDYGYFQLKVADKITPKNAPSIGGISTKPNIRIILQNHDYTVAEVKRLETEYAERYHPVFLEVKKDIHEDVEAQVADEKIKSLADVEEQNRLMREFLLKDCPADQVERVCAINRMVRQRVSEDDILQPNLWRLKRVKWENTFSYGSGNEVNFEKLPGLTGIFSPNRSGKSNFLDTILYVLFNKSARISRINKIINNTKAHCSAEAELEIGQDQYLIKRTSKKSGEGTATTVQLLKWNGNEWVSDTKLSRTDTDKYIRTLLGNFDDFIISSFSPQGRISFMLESGQDDTFRLELLSRFLGLNIFKQQYDLAHKQTTEIEVLLKQLKGIDYASSIVTLMGEIENLQESLIDLEEDRKYLRHQHTNLVSQVAYLRGMIQELPSNVKTYEYSVDLLKEMVKKNNVQIQTENENLAIATEKIRELIARPKHDRETLVANVQRKKELDRQANSLLTEIRVAQTAWKKDSSSIKVLDQQPWNDTTEICQKCEFYKQADSLRKEFQKIRQKAVDLSKRKTELETQQAELSGVETQLEKQDADEREQKRLEQATALSRVNIEKLQLQIEKLTRLIEEQNADAQAIEAAKEIERYNREIGTMVSQSQGELENVETQINVTDYNIVQHNQKIAELEQSIIQADENLQKMLNMETQLSDYRTYLKCVHREGLPYQIITSYINIINKEVDNILGDYVPFSVRFGIDLEKKMIPINLVYENGSVSPVEMGSGMEKTITAIAIRAAFANIANIPHSNIFVVDESFGQLDKEWIQTVDKLLSKLRMMFEHVILVSHIPDIQDFVSQTLSIDKSTGFSKLHYT